MSKGQRGNKEAKKPKQPPSGDAAPLAQAPPTLAPRTPNSPKSGRR